MKIRKHVRSYTASITLSICSTVIRMLSYLLGMALPLFFLPRIEALYPFHSLILQRSAYNSCKFRDYWIPFLRKEGFQLSLPVFI